MDLFLSTLQFVIYGKLSSGTFKSLYIVCKFPSEIANLVCAYGNCRDPENMMFIVVLIDDVNRILIHLFVDLLQSGENTSHGSTLHLLYSFHFFGTQYLSLEILSLTIVAF